MRRSFLLRIMTSNKNAAAAVTRATDGAVVASASTAEKGLIGGAGAEGGVSRASVEVRRLLWLMGVGMRARTAPIMCWRRDMVEWRGRGRRGGGVGEKATRGLDAPALPSLPSILPCTLTSTLHSSLLSHSTTAPWAPAWPPGRRRRASRRSAG